MDCEAASGLIMKYLDNDITEDEKMLLYGHIDICESCRLEFETLKGACLAMEDMEFEDPPKDLEAAVISRIEKEDAINVRCKNRKMGAWTALAILAGWAGIIFMLFYTPSLDIVIDSFDSFLSLSSGILKLTADFWRGALSACFKILVLGRALNVIQRSMAEIYSVFIMALSLLMVTIMGLYSYMFKTVRR